MIVGKSKQVVLVVAKKTHRDTPSPPPETTAPPLFGALRGTITVADGVDLTEPADPDWGKVYNDEGPVGQRVARRSPRKKKGGLRFR
jgi:hypothetical protein